MLLRLLFGNLARYKQRRTLEANFVKLSPDVKPQAAFEVSSQGELEQAMVLMQQYLDRGQAIQVLYCSESVQKNIETLSGQYKGLFYARALPLISRYAFLDGKIEDWIIAPVLYMARYDFFPELLLLRQRLGIRLVLISATMLNHAHKTNPLARAYWRHLYSHFNVIAASSHRDVARFQELGLPASVKLTALEWRLERIGRRIDRACDLFTTRPALSGLEQFMRRFRGKSIVLGSAWAHDLALIGTKEWQEAIVKGQVQLLVAPHSLKSEAVLAFKSALQEALPAVNIYQLHGREGHQETEQFFDRLYHDPGIILMTMPGVLCEVYSLFNTAYVGGGFGRSIHSVLEPWPCCQQIACGPKIHRSTEFEWIKHNTPDRISVVLSAGQLWQVLFERQGSAARVEQDAASALANHARDKEQFNRWVFDHA